ncbi:hypothetical protein ACQKNX_24420 [Lysinibacillus sp. NPDC093712]|uniref:hypothetical protein n=1 Tax=Lysinibacillus sp. NPDC093712 TaxID=3390579 RepID=UPI003CFF273E
MTTKTTYKVGDKVRILNKDGIYAGDDLTNGKVYEVTMSTDSDGDIRIKDDDDYKLLITADELKYIEKVAEQVAKFKVGDKVRTVNSSCFEKGEVVTIEINDESNHMPLKCTNGRCAFWLYLSDVEPVTPKPTKNQRITSLEQTVATLQAEVAALKAAQKVAVSPPTMTVKADVDVAKVAESLAKAFEKHVPKSPNEQRKAIIDEAKTFVEELSDIIKGTHKREKKFGRLNDVGYTYVLKPEFRINSKKRTVTVLMKGGYIDNGKVYANAVAKCAPDDVFNADIGKAIALGRALGLDVSKFEKAVQPSEVVLGMHVRTKTLGGGYNDHCPIFVTGFYGEYPAFDNGTHSSLYEITDDTKAQY